MLLLSYTAPFLSILAGIPLFGILFILPIEPKRKKNVIDCSLLIAFFDFIAVGLLAFNFDYQVKYCQFFEQYKLVTLYDMNLTMGADNISVVFLVLLALSFALAVVLCSFQAEQYLKKQLVLLMVMTSFSLAAICSLDLLFFFIFSEAAFFIFLLTIKIDNFEQKISFPEIGGLLFASSFLFFIFLVVLSINLNSTVINVFQPKAPDFTVLKHVLLGSLLLRIGVIVHQSWVRSIIQQSSSYILFTFSTFIGLLCAYYVIRFLPIAIVNKYTLLLVILSVAFVFIKTAFTVVKTVGKQSILKITPNIAQFLFCKIILISVICNTAQNKSLFLLCNYTLSITGLFTVSFLYAAVSKVRSASEFMGSVPDSINSTGTAEKSKLQGVLCAALFYFFASLVGVPGTFGFFCNYIVCCSLVRSGHFAALLWYAFCSLIEIFVLARVFHVTVFDKMHVDIFFLKNPYTDQKYCTRIVVILALLVTIAMVTLNIRFFVNW
ncbi:MAG: hypothetical protein LBF84_01970 [Holosporales bacterium]|jgi:NADH:ubiquinone oxidoreductase subunit 4 (subunit M)|nr:hypothetical protein [Holosporales bacterium]